MRRHLSSLLIAVAIMISLPCASLYAVSLAVSPAELIIKPGKAGYYTAVNNSKRAMAVVVTSSEWNVDEFGAEENPASEDLVVYPTHFILKGGQRRKIRVAPRKHDTIDVERKYRITIRELPVSFDEKREMSGIYMAVAYRTACYLAPLHPKSDVVVSGARVVGDALEVVVQNNGNAHQHLRDTKLVAQGAGASVALEELAVRRVMERENVHAGHTRKFTIPITAEFDPQTWKKIALFHEVNGSNRKQEAAVMIDTIPGTEDAVAAEDVDTERSDEETVQ